MTRFCTVEWETEDDDSDGDGEAQHSCYLKEGHEGELHWCAFHFCCSPVCGVDSWAAEGDA